MNIEIQNISYMTCMLVTDSELKTDLSTNVSEPAPTPSFVLCYNVNILITTKNANETFFHQLCLSSTQSLTNN